MKEGYGKNKKDDFILLPWHHSGNPKQDKGKNLIWIS